MRLLCSSSFFLLQVFLWLHEELINKQVLDLTHFRWVSLLMAFPSHFSIHHFSLIFLTLLGHILLTIFLEVPAWKNTIVTWFHHVTFHSEVRESTWSLYGSGLYAVSQRLLGSFTTRLQLGILFCKLDFFLGRRDGVEVSERSVKRQKEAHG